MTRMDEVADILVEIKSERAQSWLHNDIIKMKLAMSYDDWLEDTGIFFTLEEHIHYYLENPSLVENNNPGS